MSSSATLELHWLAANMFCPTGKGGGVDPSCSPLRGRVASLKSRLASVKESGKERLSKAVDKLPEPVKKGAAAVGKAYFATFVAANKAVQEVAKERGLDADKVAKVARTMTVADLALGGSRSAAAFAAVGLPHLSLPSMFVPWASTAWLAYSTARAPLATLRAARNVVRIARSKAAERTAGWVAAKLARRAGGPGIGRSPIGNVEADDQRRIADALADHGWEEWYLSLLAMALEGAESVGEAISVADHAYMEEPEDPEAGKDNIDTAFHVLSSFGGLVQNETYFASCERDKQGHCIEGAGGKSAPAGGDGHHSSPPGSSGHSYPEGYQPPKPDSKPNPKVGDGARPKLNADQANAVENYGRWHYRPLNKHLHTGDKVAKNDSEVLPTHEHLQAAFAMAKPLDKPVEVHRGFGDAKVSKDFEAKVAEAVKTGGAITMPGYQSTTTNSGQKFQGKVQLKIKATHGIDVKPYANSPHEDEMLLNHNSRFKVVGHRRDSEGTLHVELEQLPPTHHSMSPDDAAKHARQSTSQPAAPAKSGGGWFKKMWGGGTANVISEDRTDNASWASGAKWNPSDEESQDLTDAVTVGPEWNAVTSDEIDVLEDRGWVVGWSDPSEPDMVVHISGKPSDGSVRVAVPPDANLNKDVKVSKDGSEIAVLNRGIVAVEVPGGKS